MSFELLKAAEPTLQPCMAVVCFWGTEERRILMAPVDGLLSSQRCLWKGQSPVRNNILVSAGTFRLRDCSLILSRRSRRFFTCRATLDTSSMSSCRKMLTHDFNKHVLQRG